MRFAILIAVVLTASGCATNLPPAPIASTPQRQQAERYPFSEIGKVYETVLTAMLPRYFEKQPDLAIKHQKKLEEYVRNTFPPAKFIEMMTASDQTTNLFRRAQVDQAVRDSAEFKHAFEITVNVSVQMGMIIVAGRFDVYDRKHIHPTELSDYLFSITRDPDQEEYISWLTGEVPAEEVRKELGVGLEYRAGDRFFSFGSPEWYWKQLAGRQGYLQVREGRIFETHVTLMN